MASINAKAGRDAQKTSQATFYDLANVQISQGRHILEWQIVHLIGFLWSHVKRWNNFYYVENCLMFCVEPPKPFFFYVSRFLCEDKSPCWTNRRFTMQMKGCFKNKCVGTIKGVTNMSTKSIGGFSYISDTQRPGGEISSNGFKHGNDNLHVFMDPLGRHCF